jgi:hypothetical protein
MSDASRACDIRTMELKNIPLVVADAITCPRCILKDHCLRERRALEDQVRAREDKLEIILWACRLVLARYQRPGAAVWWVVQVVKSQENS